ncbi:MAG: type II toxin-antitoxin system VapC family toxin [Aeromicrobium sp.]|uniref:PIN domain-containing protein n=1 Tax=Aeromicrobium sp. TaxID=1871063 RepID=UPI0039E5CBAE
MIALDTNVVVRYLVRDDPDQASRADAVMDSLTPSSPGFVSSIVLAELFWVLTRSYRVAPREAAGHLAEFVGSDDIVTENPAAVRFAIAAVKDGADFADALVAEAARSAGAHETVTFDKRASAKLGFRLL